MNYQAFLLYLLGSIIFSFPSKAIELGGDFEEGKSQPIYKEKFERLDGPDRMSLERYFGETMAITFFGVNCVWCEKQHRVLKSFKNECPKLNIVMMGIGLDKLKLKRELRRNKNKFPAFRVNNNLLNALEDSSTPRLLIFDEKGKAILNVRGLVPLEKLREIMNKHTDLKCQNTLLV